MSDEVRYDVDAGTAVVRFDRPDSMNSLDIATKESLLAALTAAADDDGVRCVVITGSGRAFCVGQDLKEHVELMATRSIDEVWSTVDRHYGPIAKLACQTT